jgi:hypothetical protein
MTALTLYRITAYGMALAACMIDVELYRWLILMLMIPLIELILREVHRLIELKIIARLEDQVCGGLQRMPRNSGDVERDGIEQN